MFRIQKLLLTEFPNINETIIVENPFTLVTEHGEGLRQYQVGLTHSNLIFGCDDFSLTFLDAVFYQATDPEIETFAIVSLLPLQLLSFHFYRKQNRQIMKISICDKQHILYFEFGGHIYRNIFWNTWRERIATIRMQQKYWHISGMSPFSSTDNLTEDEICKYIEVARESFKRDYHNARPKWKNTAATI